MLLPIEPLSAHGPLLSIGDVYSQNAIEGSADYICKTRFARREPYGS
jgi:hypothetical protein